MEAAFPIRYSIGRLDTRFGINTRQLREAMNRAETLWESVTSENVLVYDPNASFKVNLIYDVRHQDAVTQKIMESKLTDLEKNHRALVHKYRDVLKIYEQSKKEFDDNAFRLNFQSKQLAQEINQWNQKGGAPESDYLRIQRTKKQLSLLELGMEQKRVRLNALADSLNDLVTKINRLTVRYNAGVTSYKDKFGEPKLFHQGEYTGSQINIYHFFDLSDLTLILTHEFGHALGIDHVQNTKSIMYYLMGDQDIQNLAPSNEDIQALKSRLQ